jgi:hypothetical protein
MTNAMFVRVNLPSPTKGTATWTVTGLPTCQSRVLALLELPRTSTALTQKDAARAHKRGTGQQQQHQEEH